MWAVDKRGIRRRQPYETGETLNERLMTFDVERWPGPVEDVRAESSTASEPRRAPSHVGGRARLKASDSKSLPLFSLLVALTV